MGKRIQKTSPFHLQQILKGQQALDMRLEGRTYGDIAKALGYANASGPYLAIQSLIRRNALESLEELRDVEGARLDLMLASVWPSASTGNLEAIDTVLKIQKRRARLYGIDKPTQVEVGGEVRHTVILKIGDQPPRLIDLANPDLKSLSGQELDMLRQLRAAQVIEGEVLETKPSES